MINSNFLSGKELKRRDTVRDACVPALNHLAEVDSARALTLIDEILESVSKDLEGGDKLTKNAVQMQRSGC